MYSWVKCFLLTHAHLDHVNGLVLSSQVLGQSTTPVYGAQGTLDAVSSIFSGRLWPRLASWEDDGHPLVLRSLQSNGSYRSVFPDVSVLIMPISHGQSDEGGTYESSAFFIRHDPSGEEFLFFGDVEPDCLAKKPGNLDVWHVVAPKIPETLSAIFIECSWPATRNDEVLYGHLNSQHLAAELLVLAKETADVRSQRGFVQEDETEDRAPKRLRRAARDTPPSVHGVLEGLRVYIIHCKDDAAHAYDRPITQVIADEVRALVEAQGLGAEIIPVEQGMEITI